MSRDNRLYLAWVVALVATLGSLYFSEVRHFAPCILCWYQRTMMYPLALLLGVAALCGDLGIRRYGLTLAAVGWLVSITQNLEVWGVIKSLKACTAGVPCDAKWPIFGDANVAISNIVTIPLLALIAFSLILGLLAWRRQDMHPTVPATVVLNETEVQAR